VIAGRRQQGAVYGVPVFPEEARMPVVQVGRLLDSTPRDAAGDAEFRPNVVLRTGRPQPGGAASPSVVFRRPGGCGLARFHRTMAADIANATHARSSGKRVVVFRVSPSALQMSRSAVSRLESKRQWTLLAYQENCVRALMAAGPPRPCRPKWHGCAVL
jgi:hypothetical protein